MIIVKILLGILLLIGFVILILLVAPIKYSAKAEKYSKVLVIAKVSLVFGLIGFVYRKSGDTDEARFKLFGMSFKVNGDSNKMKKEKKSEAKKDKKKEKKDKQGNKKNKVFIGYYRKYINRKIILQIIKKILNIIKYILPDKLSIEGDLGFEDPYYTGMYTAIYYTFYSIINRYDIKINPKYGEEVYNGHLYTKGNVTIIVVLFMAIRILFELPGKTYLLKRLILKKGG